MTSSAAIVLPGRRIEEWKYSDLRAALGDDGFGAGSARASVGPLPQGVEFFDLDDPNRPQWVNAHYGKLKSNPVSAVSLALAKGGVALRVPKNNAVDQPLVLHFSGSGNVRTLLVLEEGASLTLHEQLMGDDTRNIGLEIVLSANAQLNHVRLAPWAGETVQVEEVALTLARDARYHFHNAAFGAKLSRLEMDIALEGQGAEAHLTGVSILDEAHADITTRVHHAVPHTQSTQLFKKVAAGKSRAIYQGKVSVAPHADQTDSRQTAKAILLDAAAEADLKPELEILADDVKCAHGAAVGDLDADSLFYLRARGLPEHEARNLLIHAFLEEAIPEMARGVVLDQVNDALAKVSA
ncbi:MAG TPA: Fe-S cluster assembly protein SufD [Rhizomicrobium sp.]|nr:Fe-S cluster assembly protein SufD [Rhizomicrobium sp.]